jgi:arginine repressor
VLSSLVLCHLILYLLDLSIWRCRLSSRNRNDYVILKLLEGLADSRTNMIAYHNSDAIYTVITPQNFLFIGTKQVYMLFEVL